MTKLLAVVSMALACAQSFALPTPDVTRIAGELPAAPVVPIVAAPIPAGEQAAPVAEPQAKAPITRCYMKLRYTRSTSGIFVAGSVDYDGDATVKCEELAAPGSGAANRPLAPIELEFYGHADRLGFPSWHPYVETSYFQIRVPDPFKPETLAGTYVYDHERWVYDGLRYNVTGFYDETSPKFSYDFDSFVNTRYGRGLVLYVPFGSLAPSAPSFDFMGSLTLRFRLKK